MLGAHHINCVQLWMCGCVYQDFVYRLRLSVHTDSGKGECFFLQHAIASFFCLTSTNKVIVRVFKCLCNMYLQNGKCIADKQTTEHELYDYDARSALEQFLQG